MTKLRILLSSLFVLFVFAAVPSVSQAYDTWGCTPFNMPAFGCSGSLYGLGYLPVPPYYAVHPPVYYGQRYFRTYGESPFARPARSSRPLKIAAQVINNPFVEQEIDLPEIPVLEKPNQSDDGEEKEQVEPNQTTAMPQMIINPYYQADEVAQK